MVSQRQKRNTQRRSGTAGLIAHPAFAPILGLWGAALAGLVTLVLPAQAVATAVQGTGLAALGAQAQLVLAGAGAVMLGGALFIIALGLTHGALALAENADSGDQADVEDFAADFGDAFDTPARPIDPALDLGSVSFDEPLTAMPFAAPRPALTPAPAPRSADVPAYPDAPAMMPPPVALDLAEFAQLPGRNAVWVEAPVADAPVAKSGAAEAAPGAPHSLDSSAAALARLRAVAPAQLSTVQMVERFAGALQDHRVPAGAGHQTLHHPSAERAAALAEALKALAAMSHNSAAAPEAEPLHKAMARLQERRGAA